MIYACSTLFIKNLEVSDGRASEEGATGVPSVAIVDELGTGALERLGTEVG